MTSRIVPCLVSWRGVDGASEDFVEGANDQEEAMPVKPLNSWFDIFIDNDEINIDEISIDSFINDSSSKLKLYFFTPD